MKILSTLLTVLVLISPSVLEAKTSGNIFFKDLSEVVFAPNSLNISEPTNTDNYFENLVKELKSAMGKNTNALVLVRGNNDLGIDNALSYMRAKAIVDQLKAHGLVNAFAIGMGASNRLSDIRGHKTNRSISVEITNVSATSFENGIEINKDKFYPFKELKEGFVYSISLTTNTDHTKLDFLNHTGLKEQYLVQKGAEEQDFTIEKKVQTDGTYSVIVTGSNGDKMVFKDTDINTFAISTPSGSCHVHSCLVSN